MELPNAYATFYLRHQRSGRIQGSGIAYNLINIACNKHNAGKHKPVSQPTQSHHTKTEFLFVFDK